VTEAKCPVCSTKILPDDTTIVKCKTCGIPHHTDCFDSISKKCAIFGCGTVVTQTQETPLVITEKDLSEAKKVLSETIGNIVGGCWVISSPPIFYAITTASWGPTYIANPEGVFQVIYSLIICIAFFVSELGSLAAIAVVILITIILATFPLLIAYDFLVRKIAKNIAEKRISNQSK
jgi:hypothetical protein